MGRRQLWNLLGLVPLAVRIWDRIAERRKRKRKRAAPECPAKDKLEQDLDALAERGKKLN